MKVLVTGGTGYIGSHVCVELANAGHEIVIVDNLSNSRIDVLERIIALTRKDISFYQADLRDKKMLEKIFSEHRFDAVVHLAGAKAVGEAVENPLFYYQNNVVSSLILFEVMASHKVFNIVFSSSATVYGEEAKMPVRENSRLDAKNPYGRTKIIIEDILRDLWTSDSRWKVILLRYFNPVGAHSSGTIGESPNGVPNNLMPFIARVASGKLSVLSVFGGDYPTPDGTGIRDYIHVMDLANGHLIALDKIKNVSEVVAYNLGTGRGYSVLEVIRAFEKASGRKVPYKIVEKRPGDVAVSFADASLAKTELGWTSSRGLEEMCADAWRWELN